MADENEDEKSTTTEGHGEDISGLKSALAKEREARRAAEQEAKANTDAAKRLKEFEDKEKSDSDKLNERLQAAENRAKEAEANSLRAEIASEKGLTLAQMKRISGSTREELEADADEYRKEHGLDKSGKDDDTEGDSSKEESGSKGEGSKDDARRPKEKLRPGASSEEDGSEDYDKIADEVYKRTHGAI